MVFVNKLDRERASFERTLTQLQATFGAGIAPLELPIGEETGFRGVADLLSDTAITYDTGTGRSTGPSPTTWRPPSTRSTTPWSRGSWSPTTTSWSATSRATPPSVEELEKTLAQGVASAHGVPGRVRFGDSRTIAVDRLATFICEIGPSPAERPPVAVGRRRHGRRDRLPTPPASRWPRCSRPSPTTFGKISLFKVLSGTVRPDAVLTNSRTHADEQLHGLFTPAGQGAPHVRRGDRRRHRPRWPSCPTPGPATPSPPRARRSSSPLAPPDPVLPIAIRPEVQGRRGQADDRPAPPAGRGPGALRAP